MTAQSLIINSPYEMPNRHWSQDANGKIAQIAEGRRPAAYEMYDTRNNTRRVALLDTVNRIRQRVDEWRTAGWPGITMVTRSLLEHWDTKGEWVAEARRWQGGPRQYPFYFCQLEAIETLIWWLEAPADYRQGIFLPGDGGAWERICSKMATGSGKTTLMGLIATWQTLNALQYPKDSRFSHAIFVVAPGLTVKSRLQVLLPGDEKNVYDEFSMCPTEAMRQRLNQMEITIENWHSLMPLKALTRSVVKKGKESDEAFTRRVLGRLAGFKDLIVINDEAHHAYRQRAEVKIGKKEAEKLGIDLEEATRWIEGLDRIHKTRRIRRCFDLSATPFAPTGKTNTEAGLYEWIISDFGLNDAIEAGLVKTPRVVIRDGALANAKSYASKLYHLYREDEVRDDLNRKADSTDPLPKLVQNAYALLAYDWRETQLAWQAEGHTIPPVMLTVCNRTETAARIERFFNEGDCIIEGTQAPEHTLRVDSKVLEKAERGEKVTKDKEYAARLEQVIKAAGLPGDKQDELLALKQEEQLRALVDTVGKRGRPGQQLQNVVSVAMLSEGWDAANVTHIMGLRAFTSQLLCEQVIGRGLRRVAHDMDEQGYFLPEFVNVFGVPLSIFQEVGEGGETPPVPKASVRIEVEPGRNGYEIRWPNVVRIQSVLKPKLVVDWPAVEPLALDPNHTPLNAEVAPSLTGIVNLAQASAIDLERAAQDFRLQNLIFRATRKLYRDLGAGFEGDKQYLAIQLIRLVEQFLASEKLTIPARWYSEPVRRRLLIGLNIDAIVAHVSRHVRQENTTRLEPLFDEQLPIGSTSTMRPWLTTKPCEPTSRSQISHAVHDSTWEKAVVEVCEKSDGVVAWAKNDHLDFVVRYLWEGASRRFIPDFLIKLASGRTLVLEVKGQDSERNRAKRAAMNEWVETINQAGGFGQWCFDTVFDPAKTRDVIGLYSGDRTEHAPAAVLTQ
jgi:type III restriction enzyme